MMLIRPPMLISAAAGRSEAATQYDTQSQPRLRRPTVLGRTTWSVESWPSLEAIAVQGQRC
jgi:hypothetical protein